MKLQPIFDRVLVLPISEGRTTKGGLLIPDVASHSRAWQYGDVVAVGAGRADAAGHVVPMNVKPGDTVMYGRKSGTLIPIPGDDGEEVPHVLLREPEILAVVTDLPRDTGLIGADGLRLLSMLPQSIAKSDSSYQAEAELDAAQREGWDTGDHIDEPEPA